MDAVIEAAHREGPKRGAIEDPVNRRDELQAHAAGRLDPRQ